MRVKRLLVTCISALLFTASAPSAVAIVGGEEVDYPWAAALIRPNNGTPVEQRTYCSGVLIKPEWVLTAAHCQPKIGDTVTIGRGRLASTGGEKRTVADTRRMWDYGGYCPPDRPELCDVALVKLSTASTQPDLDLADSRVLSEWNEGTAARAYGYGFTSSTSTQSSGSLKRAHVKIVDLRDNHYTLFASGPDTAVCYGDSGGPLVVSTSLGPRVVAVVRARVGHDPTSCTPGDEQSYVKVGYRGSANNSQSFLWITDMLRP
ncbi:S1 family peptidase [Streptomyces sp. NPDC058892]|uniref:S1 family peptidase n=1 Tax=unclassified Streptomyces TaxID=2593676 RepID=UPI0036CD452B